MKTIDMLNRVVSAKYINPKTGHVTKRPYWNVILSGKYCHLWLGTKRAALEWLKEQQERQANEKAG